MPLPWAARWRAHLLRQGRHLRLQLSYLRFLPPAALAELRYLQQHVRGGSEQATASKAACSRRLRAAAAPGSQHPRPPRASLQPALSCVFSSVPPSPSPVSKRSAYRSAAPGGTVTSGGPGAAAGAAAGAASMASIAAAAAAGAEEGARCRYTSSQSTPW